MLRLILRRLLISVPLVVVVMFLTLLLQAVAPGDTAAAILGDHYTPEAYERLRYELRLDDPLPVQYWHWLEGALHGDLGVSPVSGLGVSDQIVSRFGVTLSLALTTAVLATLIGVILGVISAIRGGALGRAVDVLSLTGFALPNFWLALVLVTVFAVQLRLLPATGYVPFTSSPSGWAKSLILPVVALAVHAVAVIAKQTRDGMLDALNREFVQTLRANGASEVSIIFRHALRNAAIPVVTVIGLLMIGLLSGVVLIETVFAMPGLGELAVSAVTMHDLPMVQGIVATFTVIVVVVNLFVDLAYGWLNPKVRVS